MDEPLTALTVKTPSVPPQDTFPCGCTKTNEVVQEPTQVTAPVESMVTELPLPSDSASSGGVVAAYDNGAAVRSNIPIANAVRALDARVFISIPSWVREPSENIISDRPVAKAILVPPRK